MKKDKIAGVVILYNPTDKDIGNISTYLNEINKLYVVDNTEGHNNYSRLPKSQKIEYIYQNSNIGVASALNLAAKKAIKDGYKWILTNDQDTTFKPNIITEMIKQITKIDTDRVAIITPWHKTKLKDKKPRKSFDYPHDVMTSGNLLNLKIWQKLGGFKDWLFIDGVDIEYCLNLRKKGYDILRMNKLEIDHNLGNLFYKKIGKQVFLCTNHPAIRRYYLMRNYHYIYDMYKQYEPNYCTKLAASQKHNMIGVMLFEKNKYKKIKMYLRGYKDYRNDIKGKFKK